jgi:prolyl 3-hydroxylase /prolyl 3,4-dihydroxylase
MGLSEDHMSFLAEFINPVYLQARTMQTLASRFIHESSLELHSFLNNQLAAALEHRLRDLDNRDGLGPSRAGAIPPHAIGTSGGWSIKGPPHKWRYCTLKPPKDGVKVAAYPRAHTPSVDEIMRCLQDEFFPSPAFRAWLAIISRLLPLRYAVEARRFRPGLDYTLATSEEKEARLDVILGLMPPEKGREPTTNSNGREEQVGGWDVSLFGFFRSSLYPFL